MASKTVRKILTTAMLKTGVLLIGYMALTIWLGGIATDVGHYATPIRSFCLLGVFLAMPGSVVISATWILIPLIRQFDKIDEH